MINVYCRKCKETTAHYSSKCSICLSKQNEDIRNKFINLSIDEKLLYLYDEINKLKERNHNVFF